MPGGPCPAWLCGESLSRVLVLETGVGRARCLAALRWLTATHLPATGLSKPDYVLCAGFAGALTDECKVGDVLFVDETIEESGRSWGCAVGGGHALRSGRLLTVARLIGSPDEKRALGVKHRAVAVDMESAAAAQFCADHGIPFGSVRAISDDVATSVSPQLLRLLDGSGVSLPRLCCPLLRSPGIVRELWRLARDTRKAARLLAEVLDAVLADERPVERNK